MRKKKFLTCDKILVSKHSRRVPVVDVFCFFYCFQTLGRCFFLFCFTQLGRSDYSNNTAFIRAAQSFK